MATSNELFHALSPGRKGELKTSSLHVPMADGLGARLATFLVGAGFEKNAYPVIGCGFPYTSNEWTITTGGTGDAVDTAATAGGGIIITAASDDDFDTTLDSKAIWTPTSGKWISAAYRVRVSAVTGIGFVLGMTTGGAVAPLPFGTNYTDTISIRKAITSADVYGSVRGNSGTAAATSSALATMTNNTEILVGFAAYVHATSPEGYFYIGSSIVPFTSDQKTQLAAILTTPPTMYSTLHVTGVTGTNPTMTVTSGLVQGDR